MSFLLNKNFSSLRNVLSSRYFCSSVKVPKNVIEDLISAHKQPENGIIHERKPFKMHFQAGRNYSWCLCGRSRSQPLCDGELRLNFNMKHHMNVSYFRIPQVSALQNQTTSNSLSG